MLFQHLKRALAVGGVATWLLTISHSLYAEHIEVYPTGDESSFSIPIGDLTDITFEGKNIVFNLTSGVSRSIPMKNLSELRFSQNGLSGIDCVHESNCTFSVYPPQTTDILYLTMPDSFDLVHCSVAIYSVAGKLMWHTVGLKSSSINVSNLQSGMYILSINNLTAKFIKK